MEQSANYTDLYLLVQHITMNLKTDEQSLITIIEKRKIKQWPCNKTTIL